MQAKAKCSAGILQTKVLIQPIVPVETNVVNFAMQAAALTSSCVRNILAIQSSSHSQTLKDNIIVIIVIITCVGLHEHLVWWISWC